MRQVRGRLIIDLSRTYTWVWGSDRVGEGTTNAVVSEEATVGAGSTIYCS